MQLARAARFQSIALLPFIALLVGCTAAEEQEAPPAATGKGMAARLSDHVTMLSDRIGPRNLDHPEALNKAADYIRREFSNAGYAVEEQEFVVASDSPYGQNQKFKNLQIELPGKQDLPMIVVGAHYDSCGTAPGANDNGSGVAALLEMARAYKGKRFDRTVRLVAFTNEEPPFFRTKNMGSAVYAKMCKEKGERIDGAVILETIGYYVDEPKTQRYPVGAMTIAYGDRGNYIAVVANKPSSDFHSRFWGTFSRLCPVQGRELVGGAGFIGMDWSDQLCFWNEGYQALMITDTALYRYPHYHKPEDTADKLNYPVMAGVVTGVIDSIAEMATVQEAPRK